MAIERLLLIAIAVTLSGGCSGVRMELEPLVPSCRHTIPPDLSVQWITPFDADDRRSLRAWCEPVGPVVAHTPSSSPTDDDGPLIIVGWNMAVGEGSLEDLVKDVRTRHGDRTHMVILIQEAYRKNEVPDECPQHSGVASRLGSRRKTTADIVDLARHMDLHAVYAPSMRNGSDCRQEPREDRGNAILSTLPLSQVVAIELPFARQRRVGVAATLRDGSRVLKVLSVHFDTFVGHRKAAQALRDALLTMQWTGSVVIAGDFNVGPFDQGMKEMNKSFAEADCGGGATHKYGRLDRIFTRDLREAVTCETGSLRHGSDHWPLIARVASPEHRAQPSNELPSDAAQR